MLVHTAIRPLSWAFCAGALLIATSRDQQTPARVLGTDDSVARIEFIAVTAAGLPVTDLTTADVTVRINGRVTPIRSLALVPVAGTEPVAPGTAAGTILEAAPPPFVTNVVSATARSLILVVDEDTLLAGREHFLRAALSQFVDGLGPDDRVALATVPRGQWHGDFTSDRASIRRAISTITSRASADLSSGCRTRFTLEALTTVFESLSTETASPTIIVLSAGMTGPLRQMQLVRGAQGACELTTDDFSAVGRAAAGTHVYVVQTSDAMLEPGTSAAVAGTGNPTEGLEQLAGTTKAPLLHLNAQGTSALDRITRETSARYVARIELPGVEHDAVRPTVEVRVARGEVTVRGATAIRSRFETPTASFTARTPAGMLRDSRAFAQVGLRSTAYVSRNAADGTLKVVAAFEPTDSATRLTAAAVGVFDEAGKLVAQWTAPVEALAAAAPRPLTAAFVVGPGSYRVRVTAVDENGRGGTTDEALLAEMTGSGPLRLGGLVVGVSRSTGLLPKLQFSREPVVLGFVEMYGATEAAVIAVLELSTTVAGPALVTVPLVLSASGEPGRFRATGALPIGAVPPGDYVARAVVTVSGFPPGQVVRTIRKVP